MLPNHAPLVVAEQFGTLESLYPGRIDLALGRAPGSDQATARALRRYFESADSFPEDLLELMSYFRASKPGQRVTAVPGAGLHVPIFLLGSSDFSARLAAELGLPFAFASHFAPDYLQVALEIYRQGIQTIALIYKNHAPSSGPAFMPPTPGDQARRLFSSAQLQTLNLIRGQPAKLQSPNEHIDDIWSSQERAAIEHRTKYAAVGSPDAVRRRFMEISAEIRADEIIVTAQIFDHRARLRSFEIGADIFQSIEAA